MKKIAACFLAVLLAATALTSTVFAASDAANSDWSKKTVTLTNTAEAELSVRVGDIDALNDEYAVEEYGYNPFSAKDQYSHSYAWLKDDADPAGTDRIFVGSRYKGESRDGYSSWYNEYKAGYDTENAYGNGALKLTMSYNAAGIKVKNAILQLCIDDFQAPSFGSHFTVTLNGKDAPFIAELLNHVDQTGPTSYIISAIIPSGFYADIASGKLEIVIDETTGVGDGYAIDFAKLLVNYNDRMFTGKFSGYTVPGATVRLLGTATTVKASATGGFSFEAIPGLNAVRASKNGFEENYDFGIVLSSGTEWEATVFLYEGKGNPDIDFSKFAETNAWEKASAWAEQWLKEADARGLIPDCLIGADMTKQITRQEFAAVAVKIYEALSGETAAPVKNNPFTDCKDTEVLKAVNIGITNGTAADKFSPDVVLNREQLATMLTRIYKKVALEDWTLATDSSYNAQFQTMFTMPPKFADDAAISAFAKDSVYFMKAQGIIDGVGDNKFAPKHGMTKNESASYGLATREQALKIAVGMVENLK